MPVDEHALYTAVAVSWLALRAFTEQPCPVSRDVFLVSPDMQAVAVVRPDARGFELDDRALLGLMQALDVDLGEAS